MKKNLFLAFIFAILLQCSAFATNIKFVQVTDVHYRNNDEFREEVLEETVKSINKEKDVSFVIFTGDNVDSAKTQHLPGFVKIANGLKAPYYLVVGDNDVFRNSGMSKINYINIVKNNNWLYRPKNTNYVFKKKGFVFIVVDGAKEVIPGTIGYYRKDTLEWLDKQLNKYEKRPVIIFQHFPLVSTNEVKTHDVYQKENYLELLDKHNNVISIIAGHLHTNSEVMRNGVYHVVTPTLLNNPHSYKVFNVITTKGFSPMIYTELKEVELPKK